MSCAPPSAGSALPSSAAEPAATIFDLRHQTTVRRRWWRRPDIATFGLNSYPQAAISLSASPRGFPLRSTRRQFLLTASALVLAAALADLGLPGGAQAQSVAEAELMQPGPPGEVSMGAAT